MSQVCESKQCVVFTVDKRDQSSFRSTDIYAFDELFMKIENEQGKKKSAKKDSGIEAAWPFSTIGNCRSYVSFAAINSVLYKVGGSYYCDFESRKIWNNYRKIFHSGSTPDYEETVAANRCYENTTLVEYCDMVDDPCKWKEGPHLNFPRDYAHLLVLGGRLYAAGGLFNLDEGLSFMEMLREGNGSWVRVPNPPVAVEHRARFLSASVEEMGFILIVTGGESPSAYTYKPDDNAWQAFDDIKFDKRMVSDYYLHPAVVVGKILLWTDIHEGTAVFGVDLDSRRYFGFDIATEGLLHMPVFPNDFPQLVHLGNDELCVIWRDTQKYAYECQDGNGVNNNEGTYYGGYHCVKFCIALAWASRGKLFNLKVISRRKCFAPTAPHKFQDAFVVDVAIPKNERSRRSIPSFTWWGLWGGLSMCALMVYFKVMRRSKNR